MIKMIIAIVLVTVLFIGAIVAYFVIKNKSATKSTKDEDADFLRTPVGSGDKVVSNDALFGATNTALTDSAMSLQCASNETRVGDTCYVSCPIGFTQEDESGKKVCRWKYSGIIPDPKGKGNDTKVNANLQVNRPYYILTSPTDIKSKFDQTKITQEENYLKEGKTADGKMGWLI